MTELPILFRGPLVQAILSGQKTQTRRLVKPQPDEDGLDRIVLPEPLPYWHDSSAREYHCPYGMPGHRLWVKETWCVSSLYDNLAPRDLPQDLPIGYLADGRPSIERDGKTRVSIHMPRWASRLTLEIVEVRATRLQDISEAGAKAEGVTTEPQEGLLNGKPATLHPMTHRQAFAWLWDAINGEKATWASNPWVWAIAFKRIGP